ncbi:MAG: 4-alpha-glucanotransferase [Angelakisella sp.]
MRRQKPLARGAGILLPVASLNSPYGIGTFGKAAFEFVDFLVRAGQRYWQVLPLGPTSYGDSPYQSFSAFAGNPYFIDLDLLVEAGLLSSDDLAGRDWGSNPVDIDYAAVYRERFAVLRLAFGRSTHAATEQFLEFCSENAHWLEDYCLFMALKTRYDGKEWQAWPEPLRMGTPAAVEKARRELRSEIAFWAFCQYMFFTQWERLKGYANKQGIQIIGDIPIYVAMDSADVWKNSRLFQLDACKKPVSVAGVPPDLFSTTGQLWGNPLYDWQRMEQEGFAWWQARMAASARLYDVIRIDHFIGVVNYYSIPATHTTAMDGEWIVGPGMKLLEAITPALGGKKIIAEDLGVLTAPVRRLRDKCGYPGMRLMQFGFDSGDSSSTFLPCYFDKNCVIYAGTHDNETLAGYLARQKPRVLRFARDYLNVAKASDIPWALIRAGYESSADTAVFLVQDLLGLDNSARINTPSTIGCNWRWRVSNGALTDELAERLNKLVTLYGRNR